MHRAPIHPRIITHASPRKDGSLEVRLLYSASDSWLLLTMYYQRRDDYIGPGDSVRHWSRFLPHTWWMALDGGSGICPCWFTDSFPFLPS